MYEQSLWEFIQRIHIRFCVDGLTYNSFKTSLQIQKDWLATLATTSIQSLWHLCKRDCIYNTIYHNITPLEIPINFQKNSKDWLAALAPSLQPLWHTPHTLLEGIYCAVRCTITILWYCHVIFFEVSYRIGKGSHAFTQTFIFKYVYESIYLFILLGWHGCVWTVPMRVYTAYSYTILCR